MPRQDIIVDANYGEVTTSDNLSGKAIYDFTLLGYIDGLDNDRYIYGEITVPVGFEKRYTDKSGIHVNIGYSPSYKQLSVRLKLDTLNGSTEYITNPDNGSDWYVVYRETESGEVSTIGLSEFGALNSEGNYNFLLRNGYLAVYSGASTDFTIHNALRQNEVFLLKALASNLYQHPTTGVGLIDFLHGNFENSGLASKLQSEFENDKMVINNAYMDSVTGELILDVTEKNG